MTEVACQSNKDWHLWHVVEKLFLTWKLIWKHIKQLDFGHPALVQVRHPWHTELQQFEGQTVLCNIESIYRGGSEFNL